MFDYTRAQKVCDRQIRRFGGKDALTAKLDRNGVLRSCIAARIEYTPKERALVIDGSSRMLISVIGLVAPIPVFDLDMIIFAGERYKFNVPITGFRQGSGTVLYYDGNVTYYEKV
jgi:hypothetical protein